MIAGIRERTHWNAAEPAADGTWSRSGYARTIDLYLEVHRAAKEKPVDIEAQGGGNAAAGLRDHVRPRQRGAERAEDHKQRPSRASRPTSTRCSPSSSSLAARPTTRTTRLGRAQDSRLPLHRKPGGPDTGLTSSPAMSKPFFP